MIVFIYMEQYIISIKKNITCQDSNIIVFIYMKQYIISIKENIMCQDFNEMFNYRIKFKFKLKYIYIKIMRYKIVEPVYVAQYYEIN